MGLGCRAGGAGGGRWSSDRREAREHPIDGDGLYHPRSRLHRGEGGGGVSPCSNCRLPSMAVAPITCIEARAAAALVERIPALTNAGYHTTRGRIMYLHNDRQGSTAQQAGSRQQVGGGQQQAGSRQQQAGTGSGSRQAAGSGAGSRQQRAGSKAAAGGRWRQVAGGCVWAGGRTRS